MISSRLALRPAFFGSHTSTLGPNNAFLIPCVFNSLRIPSSLFCQSTLPKPISLNHLRTLAENNRGVPFSRVYPQPFFRVWTSPFTGATLFDAPLYRAASLAQQGGTTALSIKAAVIAISPE